MQRRVGSAAAVATVLAVVASVFSASPAWAAPPANDAFANAEVITGPLPITVSGTNVDATKEPLEPGHAGNSGGRSVWYRWTPDTSVFVYIETCAPTGFDTLLAVYTGNSVTGLTPVASSDDACSLRSRVLFTAVAGTTYHIAVDGFNGASGALQLVLRASLPGPNPPPNDAFATPQVLSGPLPIDITGSNVDASKEAFEPDHAVSIVGGASVWYSWTPETSGPTIIETCGSGFNTVLGVYTGSGVNALTVVARNDNSACTNSQHSRVSVTASAGTTYRIAVDGVGGAMGPIHLVVRPADPPPANDAFAAAQVLSGPLPISVSGTNVNASKEPGEPNHAGNTNGRSVWYRWTPDSTAVVYAETCAPTGLDSVLAVYTGEAVNALTPVASDNDNCSEMSRVVFTAVAGTTYHLAVEGDGGRVGTFQLVLRANQPGSNAPLNDDFADAQVLGDPLPMNVVTTNADASKELFEPDHAGRSGGTSLWYSWSPDVSGQYIIETCGSGIETLLGVYVGDTLEALSPVASNVTSNGCVDDRSRVNFPANAGTTYRIAVDGVAGATGTIRLLVRVANPPANDNFAAAQVLSGPLPIDVTATNADASGEPGEPIHTQTVGQSRPGGASVWFAWTADVSGPTVVSTCGSTLQTLVGIYTGTAVDALTRTPVTMLTPCPFFWTAQIIATAGQTYHIAVDGENGATGSFVLGITHPPANDNFADAQVLSGTLPIEVEGSNRAATRESGEPNHAGFFARDSVWYRWTAATSGLVTIETCDSGFDTFMAVYTGGSLNALTSVVANDDGCLALQSRVVLSAVAGQTYHIAVDGRPIASSHIGLRIRDATPPPNDSFAGAHVLGGMLPINVITTNADATRQPGEPNHAGQPGAGSLWYRWTPTTADTVVFDLCESRFDTLVAVYTGTALENLVLVAANDDNRCGADAGSYARLTPVASQTYWIAVDGAFGDRGAVAMALRAAPANDDFEARQPVSGPLPLVVHGDNYDAARQPGEPFHSNLTPTPIRSVWYSWTPQTSGSVLVESCDLESVVAVYTGDALTGLARVGTYVTDDLFCGVLGLGRMTFEATAGTSYRIAMASGSDGGGAFTLTIKPGSGPNGDDPPPNDDFADAEVLTGLSAVTTGTNVEATKEPNEPSHGTGSAASVWYSWTAPAAGSVMIETCDSDFDTLLAVYTGGAVGALTPVATNDDDCGTKSRVIITATLGTTYRIAVDGFGTATGSISLSIFAITPITNDAFADAEVLSGPLPLAATGSTFSATGEPDEPEHAGQSNAGSVWYRWTPTTSQHVAIETCDSSFQTSLAVYTGSTLPLLVEEGSNGESFGCGADGSRVIFPAVAGTVYHIAVAGYTDGQRGLVGLTIRVANRPPNDDFASAQVLPGALPVTVAGTNVDASLEVNEPPHGQFEFFEAGASVWYRWTAPTSGAVAIETCGSGFSTALKLYSGSSLSALAPVPIEEGTCGQPTRARAILTAVAGQTYRIAVAGNVASTGSFTLTLRSSQPPANDDFADAQVLGANLPISLTTTNVDATAEPLEHPHAFSDGRNSVWFRWTAPTSGPVEVDSCASDFRSGVAVYNGSSLANLIHVASESTSLSSRRVYECFEDGRVGRHVFPALAGETYWIAVAGDSGDFGTIHLSITRPPANDDIQHAQVLDVSLPARVTGTNVEATRERGEPVIAGDTGGSSVWYRFTPPRAGTYVVDTCDSGFDTLLAVYTGTSVNHLSPVAANDDACGQQSRVRITATAGTTYWVAVEGAGGATGPLRLFVRPDSRRAP